MLTGRAVVKRKDQTTGKKMKTENITAFGRNRKIYNGTENAHDQKAASRIQSNADKTETNQNFKTRTMSAALKNSQKKNEGAYPLLFNLLLRRSLPFPTYPVASIH